MENTQNNTAICSRCNGTGSYSYNLKNGSMCFGCNGTGRKLAVGEKVAAIIPAPFGARLDNTFGIITIFIPKAAKSVRGTTLKFKSEEEALAAYPQAVRK
jgi:hypothetical protein